MTLNVRDLKADSSKRARRTISFGLNLFNADDEFVYNILQWWKVQRRMTTNVRNAIMLFYDLAQGKTDKLQEYFPLVVAALTGQAVQENANHIIGRVSDVIDEAVVGITQQIVTIPASNKPSMIVQERIAEDRLLREGQPLIEVELKKADAKDVAANALKSFGGFFN